VCLTGVVLTGDTDSEGGGAGTEEDTDDGGPGSCRFSFSISSIVFRSP